MNYNWSLISEKGDYPHGFIEVFEHNIRGKKAVVIINYLAQLGDDDQKAVTTILLEGEKDRWTEGVCRDILHDAEERIKSMENLKYRVFNKLDYMTIQIIYLSSIDNVNLGAFGDFGFIR